MLLRLNTLIEFGEVNTGANFAIRLWDHYHAHTPLSRLLDFGDHPNALHALELCLDRFQKGDGHPAGSGEGEWLGITVKLDRVCSVQLSQSLKQGRVLLSWVTCYVERFKSLDELQLR